MTWLPARRPAHLRGAGPARAGLRRALRVRVGAHHRRRAHACAPTCPAWSTMLAPLGVDIAMTTNGVKLPEMAHDLAAAGLRRINVSLDSLRPEVFLALTRRDELDRVLAGIDAALDAGLDPVKVNCVVIRGVNDDEVVDLAAFGRAKGVGVRFIEFMPLDAEGEWSDATRSCRRPRSSTAFTRCSRSTTTSRRVDATVPSPRRSFRYADGLGDVGRDPERHRAVLRPLRPDPRHRRGQAPDLPLRARGVRSPGHPAQRDASRRRGRRPPRSRRSPVPSARSGRGTASARSTSCAPTDP